MLTSPNCTTKQRPYTDRRIGTWFTDVHLLQLDIQYGYNCSMPPSRTIHLTNIYCSLDYHKYRSRYKSQLMKVYVDMSAKKDGVKALSISSTVSLSNKRNVSAHPRLSR